MTIADDNELDAFWEIAREHAKLAGVPVFSGADPVRALRPPAWAFGATPEQSDELLALVLDGTKTATASAHADYVKEGEELPAPGTLGIVLDGAGHPRALVVTTETRVVPFDQVDADHARDEGEGDGSLEQLAGGPRALLHRARRWWLPAGHAGRPRTLPRPLPVEPTALAAVGRDWRSRDAPSRPATPREVFGPSRLDVDGNGCDTRNYVLAPGPDRGLGPARRARDRGRRKAEDTYTGTAIPFARGHDQPRCRSITSSLARCVAEGCAGAGPLPERAGAGQRPAQPPAPWTEPSTRKKGAGDAATWLPPNESYRCASTSRDRWRSS